MQSKKIYQIVANEFEQANQLITEQLGSNVPLVEKIAHYIVDSGGKRLRPLLVLLSAKSLEYPAQNHIKLATIIEFLHTATLLHDDVVDTSNMRRGKTTANARWGNAPSVLVGDFLYSRAFQMMVQLDSMPIMKILSDATNVIAEGEVFQLMNCKNPDVSEAQYFEVIKNKTAMLFQAASHSAAVLAGATRSQESALKNYGLHLGLAFQLIDDVLDYQGSAEEMGKNVGDDLAEGKPTLPLIYTMNHATPEHTKLIRNAIRKGGLDDLSQIQSVVASSGALTYATQKAEKQSKAAINCLNDINDSPCKAAMIALAELAIQRKS